MMEQSPKDKQKKPIIGITTGDYNGIGPEIIIRTLTDPRITRICVPIVYGSSKVNSKYRRLMGFEDVSFNMIRQVDQLFHKKPNIINCWEFEGDIQPGTPTPASGMAAAKCLIAAVADLKAGKLDALVTAPIDKSNIQSEQFKFPGHTEFLADAFGVKDFLMLLVSAQMRVALATGHVSVKDIAKEITADLIQRKIQVLMKSLKCDFGIDKPRIAVLGLNPHAGDHGLLGKEETEILEPTIATLKKNGHQVYGPYPADGFFGGHQYKKFDAVLAMYHDQGLIPFKMHAFEEGINFTAGLPIVRTSPDHGTAFDIAGKNKANETSFRHALFAAVDIVNQRKVNS